MLSNCGFPFFRTNMIRFPIRFLVAVVTALGATSAKSYHRVVSEVPHLLPVLRAEQAVLPPTELGGKR